MFVYYFVRARAWFAEVEQQCIGHVRSLIGLRHRVHFCPKSIETTRIHVKSIEHFCWRSGARATIDIFHFARVNTELPYKYFIHYFAYIKIYTRRPRECAEKKLLIFIFCCFCFWRVAKFSASARELREFWCLLSAFLACFVFSTYFHSLLIDFYSRSEKWIRSEHTHRDKAAKNSVGLKARVVNLCQCVLALLFFFLFVRNCRFVATQSDDDANKHGHVDEVHCDFNSFGTVGGGRRCDGGERDQRNADRW